MNYYNKANRTIVHFDLDTFFVSVERLRNSKLIGKPIVIGGASDRGVVSSCSYEARQYGVSSAMPMKMALRLCPDAVVVRGDIDTYSKYSKMVTEIIAEKSPLFEKASIDEHYIDISGMDRFFSSLTWTKELQKIIIKNTGLPISFGMSVNKTVSKIATGEGKPKGQLYVDSNHVRSFLFPLSIRKIPMLGNKTFRLLRTMGVSTIRTLSEIPPDMIKNLMGKNGISIWEKANGIDNTPILPYREQKSISKERTFSTDTIDVKMIENVLVNMVEKLAFELRKKQRLTACVTVKIRYSNFDTHSVQKRIVYTSFDHTLITIVKELFYKLYQRRMLIRLVGVRFSCLEYGFQQLNIFEDTPESVNLYMALDKLKKRYGAGIVRRAVF